MTTDPYLHSVLNQRYRLTAVLGGHGFGRVYQASTLSAPPTWRCIRLFTPEDPVRDQMLETFESTGRVELPNVLPWLEVGRVTSGIAAGLTFLVVPQGLTLESRLQQGPLEPAELLGLTENLATALAGLQAHGLLYLKLTPSNVIRYEDQWVLSDRDTLHPPARSWLDGFLAQTDPYWVAPELWRRQCGPEIDAWSLGLLLLRVLRGRLPYQGGGLLHDLTVGALAIPGDLPPPFDLIVPGCLNPVVERRWLGAQVLQAVRGEPVVARTGGRTSAKGAPAPHTRTALPGGQRLEGHGSEVRTIAFSPSGATLAAGTLDGSLYLWNLETGSNRRFPHHRAALRRVAMADDSSAGASGCRGGEVVVWDPVSGATQKTVPLGLPVADLAFHGPDELLILLDDGSLWVWSWRVGKPRLRETLSQATCFVPAGYQNVVWGHLDGQVTRGHEGGRIRVLHCHQAPVTAIAAGPGRSSEPICSVALDGTVWRSDGELQTVPTDLWCVAAEKGRVAAAGQDRLVYVWTSDRPVRTLKGHTLGVTSLAFSPDGSRLASGSRDRQIVLWQLGDR